MAPLVQEKCFNHRLREAVARCPRCARCFCRECVTEHEEQVLCAECLRGLTHRAERRRARWQAGRLLAAGAIGLLAAWLTFHTIGRALLLLPTSFHEGTLWSGAAPEDEE
jgi:hypothetical protein